MIEKRFNRFSKNGGTAETLESVNECSSKHEIKVRSVLWTGVLHTAGVRVMLTQAF